MMIIDFTNEGIIEKQVWQEYDRDEYVLEGVRDRVRWTYPDRNLSNLTDGDYELVLILERYPNSRKRYRRY